MKLFLWKISQDVNNDYDTYSNAIVVAPDEESARNIHPSMSWIVEPRRRLIFDRGRLPTLGQKQEDGFMNPASLRMIRLGHHQLMSKLFSLEKPYQE